MNGRITLWRVSNYASLDEIGGPHVSGRWHTKGRLFLYCSENPSTALLETLVHLEIDREDRPQNFQVLKLESIRAVSIDQVDLASLRGGWHSDLVQTRRVGDRWLNSGKSLLLEVPSVLVSGRRNYLVNAAHPEARNLRIVAHHSHPFDSRLFK